MARFGVGFPLPRFSAFGFIGSFSPLLFKDPVASRACHACIMRPSWVRWLKASRFWLFSVLSFWGLGALYFLVDKGPNDLAPALGAYRNACGPAGVGSVACPFLPCGYGSLIFAL